MKTGDNFEAIAPSINWSIHNNTITDCIRPVVMNSNGSRTSMFRDNLVARGIPVKYRLEWKCMGASRSLTTVSLDLMSRDQLH